MPPRINLLTAIRRTRPPTTVHSGSPLRVRDSISGGPDSTFNTIAIVRIWPCQRRLNSTSSKGPLTDVVEDEAKGPNQDQLPHVSEEAAQTARILEGKKCGEVGGPELEQGTPVEEIFKRDKEALKTMPKVLRDQISSANNGGGSSRSFSTHARLGQQDRQIAPAGHSDSSVVFNMFKAANEGQESVVQKEDGEEEEELIKFRLGKSYKLRYRYDGVMNLFTKLIMKHGKLSLAQKHMGLVLDHLRTAPPPAINPTRGLIESPPSPQLPLYPLVYLRKTVDSVAPLFKVVQLKGIMGGGMSLPIPRALNKRQRRRIAINWIIEASMKRKDSKFSTRLSNELVAVAEGRSAVWEKRNQIHKQAVAARANIRSGARRR
ncbi:hypothetical protein LOZ36_000144 [Ophidiomyces ophidiicola]|nr:hypothetical protein LOZ36_000144 [Ophidiomyces ophidiicola]